MTTTTLTTKMCGTCRRDLDLSAFYRDASHSTGYYCKNAPWQERDHVIPVSRGGRHSIGNLLPVCKSCNCAKGTRLLMEWKR